MPHQIRQQEYQKDRMRDSMRRLCAAAWFIGTLLALGCLGLTFGGCATVKFPDGKKIQAIWPYELQTENVTAKPSDGANAVMERLGTKLIEHAPDMAAEVAGKFAEKQ